jgi:hypothetical protein
MNVDMVGCGTINNNLLLPFLHTSTVKVMNIATCRDRASALEGRLLPLDDHFLCTKGEPYTFLENVSNDNIS